MNRSSLRRGRMVAAAVLITTASVALTACGDSDGGDSGKNASPTIAYLAPETITPRYEAIEKPALTKRLKEICPDCRLITANANSDPSQQLQQAENVIADGAKVIITNPVDSKAAAGIAARAEANDVAVISLGRLIQNANVSWSLTMDTAQAGRDKALSLAEALAEQGHPKGPIVMINGAPGDTDDAKMKQGAEEVFKEKGIEVAMRFDTPQWDPSKAQQEMDQAITALGRDGFFGVYSSNDGMAGGVIAAMKSANIDPRTRPVTGLDNDVAALQRIITGEQYMTEFQDIVDEATKAADVALHLGRGEEVPAQYKEATVNNGKMDVPTYLFEIGPINQKNIKQYFDEEKLDASKVCSGDFVAACQKLGITV
ncbi:substrate-binding domain-containing protein [Micromonospora sp. DR5-3]|uniref:substrate-binding domain-containing protein n=1 Tax=unclassified Micromonospora TaxID=2617518 RepID=UPI0011D56E19|nr:MULTISPECIES: substrate-binding domain-containing protein [unclassified Micromonospora]MCW3815774.1 substrate-binding domain-containing protein [Micromonospora sp. DR5-3]TYC21047.1 sugar ABC transporter substrate-binding protein [Micromonospora sp. MP36]